nr:immunoglobulin heavy chain junction region [Mus musculus]
YFCAREDDYDGGDFD